MLKLDRLARNFLAAGVAIVAAAGLAPGADALTLADLHGGASLSSADGGLTFSDFEITLPPLVGGAPNLLGGLDLSLFEVEALQDEFGVRFLEFDGPLVAVGDQAGALMISFRVTASLELVITGVGLSLTGTAMGGGALAQIQESVVADDGSLTMIEATRQAGGTQSPIAFGALATPSSSIEVSKSIVIDTTGSSAVLAQISEFEQSFTTAPIPEPGAVAVFSLGLGLVAATSRRRRNG